MKKIVLFLIALFLFFINCGVFAADKKVTFTSGWNTFSTTNLLSNISFSNTTGSGLYFFTLNNGKWERVLVSTGTIKPLDGFMVYNKNKSSVEMTLDYKKNLSQEEALFSKKLTVGWNLIGLTTISNPFSDLIQKKSILVDFIGFTNGIKYSIYKGDLDIPFQLGKSYLVYMPQSGVYNGTQDLLIDTKDNSNTKNLDNIINLTGSYSLGEQSIVAGAKNQRLISFNIKANEVSSINITRMKFTQSGDILSNNIINIKLVVNNMIVSTKNMTTGNPNYLDFNDINFTIPKNGDAQIDVVADFSANLTGNSFQLLLSGENIDATDSNGLKLSSSNINLNSSGPLFTFKNNGNSSLNFSSDSPSSMALTHSSTGLVLAKYNISASYDDLKLTDLYLYNKGTADLGSSIKSISLYDVNGNKLSGGSILGSQTIYFSLGSNSNFVIPRNTSNSTLIVSAVFNDITDSSKTNKTVELAIGTGSYNGSVANGYSNGAVLVSQSNGNYVTNMNSFSSTAKLNLLVRSYPIVVNGDATYSTNTFTITADSNNRIQIVSLTGTLVNPINGPTNFILYKDRQFSDNVIASGVLLPGTYGEFYMNFAYPIDISAGTTKKFVLEFSGASGVSVDSKRIFRIIDLSYNDMMDTGTPNQVLIPTINSYYNVGLPTVESTYIY
nr:hypothetical protein [Candidatus Gracilibacteria bacterium]